MRRPRTLTLLGISLTSTSVLALEILLTRIFSTLMWYHFAFMVISLALLGSGAAGVWLFLFRHRFPDDKVQERLALLSTLFAGTIVISFLVYLRIPLALKSLSQGFGWAEIGWLALIYLVLTIPFLLGGGTVALAISRFGESVGKVYFYDLVGASAGCLVSIFALTVLGGANAVFFAAVLAALAALCFSLAAEPKRWRGLTILAVIATATILASNLLKPWLEIRSRSGYDKDHTIVYEKWNALSRVSVYEDPYWLQPFGWGLSPTYVGPDPGHLLVLIDSKAGTPIQKWDRNWETIDFLRYDLTSLAYNILPEANVFIIGPGGGRDVLTALLFEAKQITGVELNPAIIDAARNQFGEYAGHVYDFPNVQVKVEDARTYLAGSDQRFDLIQASLIDTWAASSAGAFALSENGLYTREAFETYYERLSDRGLVSFSRWYFIEDPTETLRMVTLGLDAWQRKGVEQPADHIVIIANLAKNRSATEGLATMLLKRSPFSSMEIQALEQVCQEMEFTVLYAPGQAADNPVHRLISSASLEASIDRHPLDISPPTDDRPFFFNFVRIGDRLAPTFAESPVYRASAEANQVLLAVLGISGALTALFVLAPAAIRRETVLQTRATWRYSVYFAALGIGFMLIEIPWIQRLTIYLGSPTYSLAVVLFAILLSSGLGSLTTHQLAWVQTPDRLKRIIAILVLLVLFYLFALPSILNLTQKWPFSLRVLLTIIMIGPAGFLMGQPFPLGIKWVQQQVPAAITWLWAVNGTASVLGSTLATIIALRSGFRLVSLSGAICYGVALALILLAWPQTKRDGATISDRSANS